MPTAGDANQSGTRPAGTRTVVVSLPRSAPQREHHGGKRPSAGTLIGSEQLSQCVTMNVFSRARLVIPRNTPGPSADATNEKA